MGDGKFSHNSAGHCSLPTGYKLFQELTRLNECTCWVCENRTSKCCSRCGSDEMKPIKVTSKYYKFNSDIKKRVLHEECNNQPWGLRVCSKKHQRTQVSEETNNN